jgi:hypothetical protein
MGIGDILRAGKAVAESLGNKVGNKIEPDLVEIKSLVAQFSEAWWAEKDAKQRKEKIKEKILRIYEESGADKLDGDEGLIRVIRRKDSIGLITEAVKEILTTEQLAKCTGVTRKGGVSVEFTPASKRSE